MKTIQIQSGSESSNDLLKAAGVKRIHGGWYTVQYHGVNLDASTVAYAKRNPKGQIKH